MGRKRNRVSSSDSNGSDEDYNENNSNNVNQNKQLIKIKDLAKQREIQMSDIIHLDISDDDKIWFYEQIQIFKNLLPFTEERYKQKRSIYDKYIEVTRKNSDHIKIEEELKNKTDANKNLLTRILESTHDQYTKAVMYKKYCTIKDITDSDEKFKIQEFIEIILGIPTGLKQTTSDKDINELLINLEKALTKNIYGLYEAKEKLLEIYCGMLSNPNYKNRCLAFVGPAGVGKTAFAKTIAEALDLPFEQISMGSVKDACTLTGHSMTYIGSQVGLIVSALRKLGIKNGVIFLDELDKVPDTAEGHSILSVLLHVLDRKQNDSFTDMYAPEIKVDLSNILFLVAMNDDNKIDPILRDRLHIIKINGYNVEDKITIARDYILPKIMTNLTIKSDDLIFSDDVIRYIIEYKNYEKGVRQLELDLTTICERVNVISHVAKINKHKRMRLSYDALIDKYKKPFILTRSHIDTLLK